MTQAPTDFHPADFHPADFHPADFHLARMIADSAARFADRPATRVEAPDGSWQVQTYRDFHAQIQQLAAVLVARGLEPGDRVAIFSGNRPEWSLADFAVLAAGGIVVPIFAVSTAEQVRHVLTDSGSTRVFVAGQREAELVRQATEGLAAPELVSFDQTEGVTSLAELLAGLDPEQATTHLQEVERRTAAGRSDHVATIVYTSGTTGLAKGVMLTHGGFGNQQEAIDDCWNFRPTDHSLCFLPLAHALERDWSFHVFHRGCMNTYCTNPKQVARLLAKARPTLLVSVPMLFEKVMSGVWAQASSRSSRRVLRWALGVGAANQRAHVRGQRPSLAQRLQLPLADRLVLSRIRSAVGGNKTLMVAGGAPQRREVEEFFSAAGILLGQGYGLTESGPMMTIYRCDRFRFGTVGFPIKGNQIRVADNGELLVRGPSVMKGYWNNPAATAEVLQDGWLHTGDIGSIDPDGFVRITDRLKDIVVTANGKNVAPQAVEAALMADPGFGQAVVVGDARPCLVAVVEPTTDCWRELADEFRPGASPQELAQLPQVVDRLAERAALATAQLAHHEQVRGVVVSVDRFSLSGGLVTSTLKVKRRAVETAFEKEIERTYRELARRRHLGAAAATL